MENLGFGFQMTLLGMGIVFSLLALLWGLLALLLRFDRPPAVAAAPVAEQAPEPMPRVQVLTHSRDPDLVAAITVAVLTHWAVRRKQAAPAMRSYWPGSLLPANRWVTAGRAQQHQGWQRRR
ncbi:MAG TPA: OadG family transporter subunit [Herpetosiphonaceae bacterium]